MHHDDAALRLLYPSCYDTRAYPVRNRFALCSALLAVLWQSSQHPQGTLRSDGLDRAADILASGEWLEAPIERRHDMEGFLARAEIMGRADHQPPLRQTTDERMVTNITVYTNFNQRRAGETSIEITDRHHIVVWDRLAELCAQHIRAGTRIYAEGRLTTRHWIDRETGERRSRTEIHATNVIFLGGVQHTNLVPGYVEDIPEELYEGEED